jgi:HK97 family phage prohead protease
MLQRFCNTRAEKVEDRKFKFVISDESKDRYGTVIKLDGWQLDNYNRNGIVAYQHNTGSIDPDMIVGKGRTWIDNGVLMGEVEFEPEGENQLADKLVKKLAFGSINATSVGFNPMEWSKGDRSFGEDPDTIYFRKQDLLEFSIVNIPANANAVVSKSLEEFVRMATEDEIVNDITEAVRMSDPDTKGAEKWMSIAIRRHKRHMSNQEPTTGADGEISQKLMMEEMMYSHHSLMEGKVTVSDWYKENISKFPDKESKNLDTARTRVLRLRLNTL